MATDEANSRRAIKDVALDLLIRHGYRGMRFADISAKLGTTRANIHYHFGSKGRLIDEVLADYVEATLGKLRSIWSDGEGTFADRVELMLDYSRQRFLAFNPGAGPVQPWSLISRLRQDEQLLSDQGRERLRHFTVELEEIFGEAMERAAVRREIAGGKPVADLALLLAAIADNAAPITLAGNSFARLEATYRGLVRLAVPPLET